MLNSPLNTQKEAISLLVSEILDHFNKKVQKHCIMSCVKDRLTLYEIKNSIDILVGIVYYDEDRERISEFGSIIKDLPMDEVISLFKLMNDDICL